MVQYQKTHTKNRKRQFLVKIMNILKISKMAARGPQNGRRGLEMFLLLGYWPLSLNKFFDPSTPSMRKGRDGEKMECYGGGK